MADWQLALESLSGVPDLLEQRMGDVMKRARAKQIQSLVHDSLRPRSAGDEQNGGEHPRVAS